VITVRCTNCDWSYHHRQCAVQWLMRQVEISEPTALHWLHSYTYVINSTVLSSACFEQPHVHPQKICTLSFIVCFYASV